jgi:hypothetical protein
MSFMIFSFSGWAWIDILGTSMVAIGCIGELCLLFKKAPTNAVELKAFESKKHSWERVFVGMVAIGVAMELIGVPDSLHETAELVQQNIKLEQQIEQTSNSVVTVDPRNQQAQSAKALVFLWTEVPNPINWRFDLNKVQIMSSKLAFGDPDLMRRGAPTLLSPIFRIPLHPLIWDGTNLVWRIYFERDDDVFSELETNVNVVEAINWRKFEIGVPFLPAGTKILKGNIRLTVNDMTTNITFGSQVVRNSSFGDFHAFWDNLTNGIAIFDETNVVFNWLPP